ncbi:alpha/beta fold hydrolase [Paenibacillus cymbidii]|uniref:alpha/beta fold hydrolase n=1 Tax=Paenibacillus cymbidii TaxID=1639034 RepID=UPI0010807D56|nr:alpha/beta fold hydrolase [Paenibacillus cymbidii]
MRRWQTRLTACVTSGLFALSLLAGAWGPAALVRADGDTTPPAAVTNVTVDQDDNDSDPATCDFWHCSSTSLKLIWTAPGDDGSTGTAQSYDIRYSTATITSANWASATPVATVPVPAAAGTTQIKIVRGLTPNTTYYFAMKTKDEAGNESGLSNVGSKKTNAAWGMTLDASKLVSEAGGGDLTKLIDGNTATTWDPTGYPASMNVNFGYLYNNIVSVNQIKVYTTGGTGTLSVYAGRPGQWSLLYTDTLTGTPGWLTHTVNKIGSDFRFALTSPSGDAKLSEIQLVGSGAALDTTPPGAVTNLTAGGATASSVQLAWTAPGNDDDPVGFANSYDIRYSTSPITDANWAGATQATGEPTPTEAGTSQSMTIGGLAAGTTYYFALKASDLNYSNPTTTSANTSALSNVASAATTGGGDTTAPAAVANLAAGSPTSSSVTLTWTAPGDDGTAGTAASYDIRYSTATITDANWAGATPISGEPAPAAAGTSQSKTVSGLAANSTYYFAMKTSDEVPNVSALSNVASAATTATPDTTAPAAVANLAAGSPTSSSVTLTWTAPGDDGAAGTAASYDIRYSSATITDANWAGATPVSGEPAPAAAGTSQSKTVSGLAASTTYYFAMKTSDEVPNVSALSNVASATTTAAAADTTAPAPITSLSVDSQTGTTITLKWTATGDDGNTGQATSYEVRYSDFYPTMTKLGKDTWTGAPVYAQSLVPKPAGQQETLTVTGLKPGKLYSFTVEAKDEANNSSGLSDSVATMTNWDSAGASAGLVAESYDDTGLTAFKGRVALGSFQFHPWDLIVSDYNTFGSRVTGQVTPQYSQTYTFYAKTSANDGVRLWVNRQLLVDTWSSPTATEQSGTIALTANQAYEVRAEYYGASGSSFLQTSWSSASQSKEIIHTPRLTALTDTIAPNAITNAAVSALGASSVRLTFTAPGDDDIALPGMTGPWGAVSAYEVRYSTAAITDANWNAASKADIWVIPQPRGGAEALTVAGLKPGTTYYVAVKAIDEAGNAGPVSNAASAATTGTADNTAPAAVSGLSAANAGLLKAQLSWTAPGDDGGSGTAAAYDVRFSTSAITAANWDSAAEAFGEPAPLAAGSGQTMTVGGLQPGTTYYFALKTIDEVGNVSALSNVASLTATAAPAGGYVTGGASSLELHASLAQAGNIYYVVYNASQGTPTAAAVKAAAQGATGGALVKNGTIAVTAGSSGSELVRAIAALPENATYYTYWVGETTSLGTVYSATNTLQVKQKDIAVASAVMGATFHYLAYEPESAYRDPNAKYPLLLFLHGQGESFDASHNLNAVKLHGPPMLIAQGQELPFIVISPQKRVNDHWYTAGFVDEFVQDAMKRYPIDPQRIYVTGLSVGGGGAFYYADEHPEKVAAVIPVAGKNNIEIVNQPFINDTNVFRLNRVPMWTFNNADDPTVGREGTEAILKLMVNSKVTPDPSPMFTVYQQTGHGGWDEAYGNPAIYTWLLSKTK